MDYESILEQVRKLAAAQFGEELEKLREESTAADVKDWNSLSHVMLVASIEKSYDIKFDLLAMTGMRSLGDIARAVREAL